MEDLSIENILSDTEINELFATEEPVENKKEITTEEDKTPESVGSIDTEEEEDVTPKQINEGDSPKLYSSIAHALKEDDIFHTLSDEEVKKINTAEDFAYAMEKEIQAKLDEKQKRIDEALNYNVHISDINKYEKAIEYLDNISEENLKDESDNGEKLRQQLIYTDLINRGYSKEKATREVKKSFDAGTDIDDARDALESSKDFFKNEYNTLIKESQKKIEQDKREMQERGERLKKSIMEDPIFKDLQVDKLLRQKIYNNISKPVYKDEDTGTLLTEIQRYEREHRDEFLKNVGILYTLTDGFKSLDSLIKGKVRKEVKKGLRELENTLNNTMRDSDGNLKFVSGLDDPESSSKDWEIDI